MEASEMLDVVHYFLDEDMRYVSVEEMNMHSHIRNTIFSKFYGITYKYGVSTATEQSTDSTAVKPYIPPTEMDSESNDPFGGLLDSPLN